MQRPQDLGNLMLYYGSDGMNQRNPQKGHLGSQITEKSAEIISDATFKERILMRKLASFGDISFVCLKYLRILQSCS